MKKLFVAAVFAAIALAAVLPAQEREDRTLLSQAQMTAIINEVSGERVQHHVLEMVPWQRVRAPEEYNGHFRETDVMVRLAKEYGFENVAIESFAAGQAWQPTQGELWMTAPKSVKLYDIHDIALSLASLNSNGEVSGELVDIGAGTAADFASQGPDGQVRAVGAGGERPRADLQPGHRQGRRRRGRPQPDRPRSARSTTRTRSSRRRVNATKEGTAAWNVSPRVARELQAPAGPRRQDHAPVDREERAGADAQRGRARRDPRRRQRRRRRWPSAATSTRA